MASHLKSAVVGIVFTLAPLLALLQAVSSAEVALVPDVCSWTTTRNCYAQLVPGYMDELLPDAEGNFNDKEYAKVCRELPMHSRCYNQLSICPDELKANFSFFEEGYRRLRDFTCDRNELKGVYKLFACLDENLVKECTRKYLLQVSEGHYHDCREASVNSMCVDETSHQSCPVGYEASRGSFKKLNSSVQMLLGCERSSQATVVPHSIIMALVVAIFFLRVQSA